MSQPVSGYGLYEALKDEGFTLPDETADVKINFDVDSIVQLLIVINLTDETMTQFGRAMIRMAEKNKKPDMSKEELDFRMKAEDQYQKDLLLHTEDCAFWRCGNCDGHRKFRDMTHGKHHDWVEQACSCKP